MASIREIKTKDGERAFKVTVLISSSGGAGGKQVRKSRNFRPDPAKSERQNLKDLRKFADEFEEKCKNGSIVSEEITLRQYAERWLENYVANNVAETTARKYKDQLDKMILPYVGYVLMSEIKPSTVAELLKTLEETTYKYANGRTGKYSVTSIKDAKATLSTLCTSAVLDGLLPFNPCTAARVRSRKGKRKRMPPKAFSVEQAIRFLDMIERPLPIISPEHYVMRRGKKVRIREYISNYYEVQLKYKCAFQVAIFAGIRGEEACGLDWRDVDLENNTIEVNKAAIHLNKKLIIKEPKSDAGYRKIFLPPAIMKNLKALKRETMRLISVLGTAWKGSRDIDDNPVFCGSEGGRMWRDTFNKELHRVIHSWNASCKNEEDKLPVLTFHQLRHTHASILIAEGMEAPAVAARLGHSDASITLSIYAHSFEERDQKASNILENVLL